MQSSGRKRMDKMIKRLLRLSGWGRQLTKSGKQECEGLVDVPGRNKERGELSRLVRGTGSRGAGI